VVGPIPVLPPKGSLVRDGRDDLRWAIAQRELRLPAPLRPLARLARNYRWSWTRGGPQLFAHLSRHGWERAGENPVRLLRDLSVAELEAAAADEAYVAEVRRVAAAFDEAVDVDEAAAALRESTVAFLCAEYAVHPSLPIYSGGLGALAGDILKEASDLRVPMAAVGLFYHQGYFHQRLDPSGQQHEYWIPTHAEDLAAVPVTDEDGRPVEVRVPIEQREVAVRIWRVDVGRVPLFLLDSDVASNAPYDRWITARLYVSDRDLRLAQYALLGVGGVRALSAMGFEPSTVHLNEGHAALATLELARAEVERGASFADALAAARDRTVFTTHTPVPAGNETYPSDQMQAMLAGLPSQLGVAAEEVLDLGRVRPGDHGEWPGMTVLGLRTSRAANGVSREHGRVARGMWQEVFGVADAEAAPIGHVTNGVHHPTWMAPAMRRLLDAHLPEGWFERIEDPEVWSAVDDIPAAAIWEVRDELRSDLIDFVRDRSLTDRLGRSEPRHYTEAAAQALDPGVLTLGFARRVATYKRLGLLMHDPERALALLDGATPVQLLIAGKAHPADDGGKSLVRELFALKGAPNVAERVVFLEDYDLAIARRLVAGCDVWVNLPRPPMEASGTSGMKSVLNGGLQLSVADGWWAEGYDGSNGWSIPARTGLDEATQDDEDAETFYRLLEQEVVPTFAARDADGVPTDWVAMVKASLRTLAPQFAATRMVREYRDTIYAVSPDA
jgi:glycogen phosphorylase